MRQGQYLEQAARVTDGVEHGHHEVALGLSVVFFAGGLVLMGPLSLAAAAAVVGTAGFAQGVGKIIDRQLDPSITERIKKGAKTVFMDEPRHPAAIAKPTTTLGEQHASHWVTKGSDVVLIERFNASRYGAKTSCVGTVVEGSGTIFIGGVSVYAPGAPTNNNEVLGNGAYQVWDTFLRFGGYASLPRSAWGGGVYLTSALQDFYVDSQVLGDALVAEGARSRLVDLTRTLGR